MGAWGAGQKNKANPQMSIFDCPLYSPRTPEGGILQDPRGQKGAAMLKEGVSRRVQGGQRNRKEVRTQTT